MKKFRCPNCGKETIEMKERIKIDYRHKSDLQCSNCKARLRVSSLTSLLILVMGLIGGIIALNVSNLIVKVILLILLGILFIYLDIYWMPIVKDE